MDPVWITIAVFVLVIVLTLANEARIRRSCRRRGHGTLRTVEGGQRCLHCGDLLKRGQGWQVRESGRRLS